MEKERNIFISNWRNVIKLMSVVHRRINDAMLIAAVLIASIHNCWAKKMAYLRSHEHKFILIIAIFGRPSNVILRIRNSRWF